MGIFGRLCLQAVSKRIPWNEQIGSRFLVYLLLVISALPMASIAEEARARFRLGVLGGAFETNAFLLSFGGEARLLEPLGYVEGKNLVVERRTAVGSNDDLPKLAAELVDLRVDLIATSGMAATRAAREATRTIPIVMVVEGDPVAAGLVETLGRPGGNVTGIAKRTTELNGKRLQFLIQLVPGLKRVGVFWNPANPEKLAEWRTLQSTAKSLGLELESFKLGTDTELEPVFDAVEKAQCGALLVTSGRSTIIQHGPRIGALSTARRIPAIFPGGRWMVQVGSGLLSYGPNRLDLSIQFATYIDKVLRGVAPADLPIEQPRSFELFLNNRVAKEIGIQFPQSLLIQADTIFD